MMVCFMWKGKEFWFLWYCLSLFGDVMVLGYKWVECRIIIFFIYLFIYYVNFLCIEINVVWCFDKEIVDKMVVVIKVNINDYGEGFCCFVVYC